MSIKLDRARRAGARRSLKNDPANQNAWCELAEASFALGEADAAVDACRRAALLAPLTIGHAWLLTRGLYAVGDEAGAGVAAREAAPLAAASDYPGPEFRRLVEVVEAAGDRPLETRADFHVLVGASLRYGPFNGRAGEAFERALAIDPSHDWATLRRWEHLPPDRRSLEDLDALSRRGRDVKLLAYVARYARDEAPAVGERACLAALNADPWDPWGDSSVSQIVAWLWRAGHEDDAVALARRGLAHRPRLNLAVGWSGQGLHADELTALMSRVRDG
ncbi:MAG: hypothetical protein R3A48_08100 [Polyangiales bacterium]